MAKKTINKNSVEVENGVYLLDKTNISQERFSQKKTVFTILGKHKALYNTYPVLSETDDSIDIAYAKCETIRGKQNYFIKTDAEGLLFNPISADPNTSDYKFKVMKQDGTDWQYQKVTEACFNQYIEFLRTKNILYLKYAQRIFQ